MRNASLLIRRAITFAAISLFAVGPPAHAQESGSPSQGVIEEPGIIERTVIFVDRRHGNGHFENGFYWDVWNMIPGAGWISGGPGYRKWYAKDRVFVDGSAAVSWGGYKTAQARFELPKMARSRLALGSQLRWSDFTHVSFFGEGAASRRSDHSEYRVRS